MIYLYKKNLMKIIINEEIKRIQELMGIEKSLIKEQWWKLIDDFLKVTPKTDDFFKKIAVFGGKNVTELETSLKRGDDILTALGKNEDEFANFIKNDRIIFNKFADEFVKNDVDAIRIEKTYMNEISKLTTKEDIDNKLREFMILAKRDNKLGDAAVLQKMHDNIGNISRKTLENTIGKQFKTFDDFIATATFKTNFGKNKKSTINAYKEFTERNWDSIKNLKTEKDAYNFIRNDSGILTTEVEKKYFDKFIANLFKGSPVVVGLKIGGAAVGGLIALTATVTALWTAASWIKCVAINRKTRTNAPAFCSTEYFWGTADDMLSSTAGTQQQGETKQQGGTEKDKKVIKTGEGALD